MSKTKMNYKNTHFELPELTRIYGKTKTLDLITLQRQVRSNASTVDTTLCGNHNLHLGLACTSEVYATALNSRPYQQPHTPPPLNVAAGATQFQIQQARG